MQYFQSVFLMDKGLQNHPQPPLTGQTSAAGTKKISGFQGNESRKLAAANVAPHSRSEVKQGIKEPQDEFDPEQESFREQQDQQFFKDRIHGCGEVSCFYTAIYNKIERPSGEILNKKSIDREDHLLMN